MRADADQLFRVLSNLVRNATQAIEAGAQPGSVTVTASEITGHSEIRVRDTGPGLPQRARDNLFQPFRGSVRQGGSGLGLVIAADLVRGHGGTLVLEETGLAWVDLPDFPARPGGGSARGLSGRQRCGAPRKIRPPAGMLHSCNQRSRTLTPKQGPLRCAAAAGIPTRALDEGDEHEFREVFRACARIRPSGADHRAPGEPPAVPAGALAQGAARRRPGAGGQPDCARRRQRGRGEGGGRAGAGQAAPRRGRRHGRRYPDREGACRGGKAGNAGRRQLRDGRAAPDRPGGDEVGRERCAEGGGRDGAGAERGDQRHPQGADGRHGERRAGV